MSEHLLARVVFLGWLREGLNSRDRGDQLLSRERLEDRFPRLLSVGIEEQTAGAGEFERGRVEIVQRPKPLVLLSRSAFARVLRSTSCNMSSTSSRKRTSMVCAKASKVAMRRSSGMREMACARAVIANRDSAARRPGWMREMSCPPTPRSRTRRSRCSADTRPAALTMVGERRRQ